MTARPAQLAFVSGTGTEIGKTWIATAMLRQLRSAGTRVAARKPAQSFVPGEQHTDADVLAAATGETPHEVCAPQRWYGCALAPPMAAEALGKAPFTVDELVAELCWPDAIEVGLVEGAGGPRSPLAADGDNVSLARAIAVDTVVLVAHADLGTINAVRMSVDAFAGLPVVVVLNRYDDNEPIHRANRDWLASRYGLEIVVGPEAAARRLSP
ncbi:MAG TPA: dethiobiotin synthase [Acidimicrobiia bacterium]